jgi:aminomethyltransferase
MSNSPTLLKTPLTDLHRSMGGKMVAFAGWEMPVHYPTGIVAEHQAVRSRAGVFDVSHMGEFEVTGPDRNAFVNRVTCNDVAALAPGQVQYSAVLTKEGTFVDDCTVYRFDDKLMLVVNAANRAKAWSHVVDLKAGSNVRLRDISDDTGLLAVQGPAAEAMLQPIAGGPLAEIGYYHHVAGRIGGVDCFVSRTGYTGEDGFELYCRWRDTVRLWEAVTGAGAEPIGLGARDSLRLEMGYALYGQEIDDTVTPFEAGLQWIVKLDKGAPFIGREALLRQKERGLTRKLVGFRLHGRGIARPGYPVWLAGNRLDRVRSGGQSPSLGVAIGTTFLPTVAAKEGQRFEVECRGERLPAEVVRRPFWERGSVRRR